MSAVAADPDRFDARLAHRAAGLVREFNQAGVLGAADVHVATRLAELAGESEEAVALAVALAVRAPRLGHVHVDLRGIRASAAVESDEQADLDRLPWPDPASWLAAVAASPLVGAPDGAGGGASPAPLRLEGSRLYLDRYWAEECQVATELLARAGDTVADIDGRRLEDDLDILFAGPGPARRAAENAVRRRLSVIAGGPGTGKTTTIARVVALLFSQARARGERAPLIALAAPTGKAKARLEEAVHAEARELAVGEEIRGRMLNLEASTLHRLLGRRRDSDSRFRHDRSQRLPHDVVIVDEASMVSLSLMARLLEAVRPAARLVLVGDPGQLASIEAGAVLGDIISPAGLGPLAPGVAVLDRGYRFGGAIAQLATAVRQGDADRTVATLRDGAEEITWLPVDAADDTAALDALRDSARRAAAAVILAARTGETRAALDALGAFRLLCAHRRGPYGVAAWAARVESWLAGTIEGFDAEQPWYAGRPLLVTENDYELDLYNGDTGVVVAQPDGRLSAAFERRGELLEYSPARLGAVDTVYAMTIHKSQGSQFDTAAVLLPQPDSRLLSRELLYTALTRARERLIVAGTEEAIRAAVERPIARASGLQERLSGTEP